MQNAAQRCGWVKAEHEIPYHDNEWGFPEHNDQKLFEMLILEGMQAGLTWSLILKRRENMRRAFDGFDPAVIARYDDAKKAELLQDAGIIRNRAKINALVTNAQAFLRVQQEEGSFDAFIWSFTGGKTLHGHIAATEDIPAKNELSDAVSAALKKRGFKFVGSTICYAYLQAIGVINDHLVSCPWYKKALEAAEQ